MKLPRRKPKPTLVDMLQGNIDRPDPQKPRPILIEDRLFPIHHSSPN